MIHSGQFRDKKILIVDKEEKNKNDRTWCFWEKEPGLFEPVVYQKWKQVWFHGEKFSKLLSLSPYEYKLIRGIDFYNYCFELINKQSNIEILYGEVQEIQSDGQGATLKLNEDRISAHFIFNSILFDKPVLKKKEFYLLHSLEVSFQVQRLHGFLAPGAAVMKIFRYNMHRELLRHVH